MQWRDREAKTPLIVACMNPELYNVAKTLIELGANVNAYRPGIGLFFGLFWFLISLISLLGNYGDCYEWNWMIIVSKKQEYCGKLPLDKTWCILQ